MGSPGEAVKGGKVHKRKYYIQQIEGWSQEKVAEVVAGLRRELWNGPVIQQILPPANSDNVSVWEFGQGFSVLVMTRTPADLTGRT